MFISLPLIARHGLAVEALVRQEELAALRGLSVTDSTVEDVIEDWATACTHSDADCCEATCDSALLSALVWTTVEETLAAEALLAAEETE